MVSKYLLSVMILLAATSSFGAKARKKAVTPTAPDSVVGAPSTTAAAEEKAEAEKAEAARKAVEARREEERREEARKEEAEAPSDEIAPFKTRYGIHAGLSIANAVTDPALNSSNRYGFAFGLKMSKPLIAGFLYLQPELNYFAKGAENNHFGPTGIVRADYIEIPVLAKLELLLPSFRPFVTAGPGFAFALSKTVEGVPNVGGSALRMFDFTASFGLGCAFVLGDRLDSTQVTVEGRYSVGLVNMTPDQNNWKNSVFLILAGIQL